MRHIGVLLSISSDTLKGIVCDYLPQQYTFSRKETIIDTSYDGSKLFTTLPKACRVILGSTPLNRYDALDFLVKKHNHLQDQSCEAQKKENMALDDNIFEAKNY